MTAHEGSLTRFLDMVPSRGFTVVHVRTFDDLRSSALGSPHASRAVRALYQVVDDGMLREGVEAEPLHG